MPARTYYNLGGIQGIGTNPKQPYSTRGKDMDRIQTFVFECDPMDPFTGIVELQISNEASPVAQNTRIGFDKAGENMLWSSILELDITAENGTFFVQTEVEASVVRVACTSYTDGRITQVLTMK